LVNLTNKPTPSATTGLSVDTISDVGYYCDVTTISGDNISQTTKHQDLTPIRIAALAKVRKHLSSTSNLVFLYYMIQKTWRIFPQSVRGNNHYAWQRAPYYHALAYLLEHKYIKFEGRKTNTFFITLTYGKKRRRQKYFSRKDIESFLAKMKYRNAICSYVQVLECHSDGVPHYHLLITVQEPLECFKHNGDYLNDYMKEIVEYCWSEGRGKNRKQLGHVKVKGICGDKRNASNIVKYLVKELRKQSSAEILLKLYDQGKPLTDHNWKTILTLDYAVENKRRLCNVSRDITADISKELANGSFDMDREVYQGEHVESGLFHKGYLEALETNLEDLTSVA